MSSNAATLEPREAPARKQFGVAWLLLCAALAAHVTDEALTNFLSLYNPIVLSIRSRLPFLPVPTFSFSYWLAGLIVGVILLVCISPFVFRGAQLVVPLAYLFAMFMLVNSLLHIAGSIYMKKLLPGVYSAPLLLAGSLYLLDSVSNFRRKSS